MPASTPTPKKKSHLGNHHIVPTSRGGPDYSWNFFSWASSADRDVQHAAWHVLFVNLLPSEAITTIRREWSDGSGALKVDTMGPARRRAWGTFFGQDAQPADAIRWVEENFLYAEKHWRDWLAQWQELLEPMTLAATGTIRKPPRPKNAKT